MRLPEHSHKGNEVSNDEDTLETRDHANRLNNIYQGSLRESGSTLDTPIHSGDGTSSVSSKTIYCHKNKLIIAGIIIFFISQR